MSPAATSTQRSRSRAKPVQVEEPAGPEIATRKPTGLPPWPILLLAGPEKTGKSYACALASASPLIGRTFWIGVGEEDPDEYGAIEGADFDIVDHDGGYRSILDAVTRASAWEVVDGKPVLIVFDSASRLWSLLTDDAQATANARARRKAQRDDKPMPEDDVEISMDLWNITKSRWYHVLDTLKAHRGPVIITARMEMVTVVENGRPTTERLWKIQAEKNLGFDVSGIVEMPELGTAVLRGMRSTRIDVRAFAPLPDFTVHDLWILLGLDGEVGERTQIAAKSAAIPTEEQERIGALIAAVAVTAYDELQPLWKAHVNDLDVEVDGQTLRAAILARKTLLEEARSSFEQEPPT